MFLREFLYVDADKVRGLLAQLDEGIIETSTETATNEKATGGGVKGFAEHSQRWGGGTSTTKSQGDALFPALESALESEGLLIDLSERLSQADGWERLSETYPPGTLVRITAHGAMFDARYLASTFAAFSTTAQGFQDLEDEPEPVTVPSGQRGRQTPKKATVRKPLVPDVIHQIEDAIPDQPVTFGGSEAVTGTYLKGIVRIARGMFTPGLHLNLRPTGESNFAVTARLQEGRQFLDGDPEILFARYGVIPQQWTLVGTVGFYAPDNSKEVALTSNMLNEGGTVNRSGFVEFVNGVMQEAQRTGFVDAPQPPGFSVVPLAVYRGIGSPDSVSQSLEHLPGDAR